MLKGFEEYQQKAKKAVMDYSFHMAVTRFDDKVRRLRILWQAHHLDSRRGVFQNLYAKHSPNAVFGEHCSFLPRRVVLCL